MVQVIVNGVALGYLSEMNARVYLNQTKRVVVSQTNNTICMRG